MDSDLDNNIIDYYSSIKFYKKRIKELELEIYKLKLEIDYLKKYQFFIEFHLIKIYQSIAKASFPAIPESFLCRA